MHEELILLGLGAATAAHSWSRPARVAPSQHGARAATSRAHYTSSLSSCAVTGLALRSLLSRSVSPACNVMQRAVFLYGQCSCAAEPRDVNILILTCYTQFAGANTGVLRLVGHQSVTITGQRHHHQEACQSPHLGYVLLQIKSNIPDVGLVVCISLHGGRT